MAKPRELKKDPGFKVPEGYEERSTDIKGFLDAESEEAPVTFVPLYAKAIDNGADKKKSSTLVICRYVDGPTVDSDGNEIPLEEDELVGLWFKPGMKAISELCGVDVIMWCNGELETGKPNPMKTFKVLSRQKGTPLFITEDHRRQSAGTPLPFPVAG